MKATEQHTKAIRQANRAATLADLRDGRRQRAVFFAPAKGKGSYKRKAKHGKEY